MVSLGWRAWLAGYSAPPTTYSTCPGTNCNRMPPYALPGVEPLTRTNTPNDGIVCCWKGNLGYRDIAALAGGAIRDKTFGAISGEKRSAVSEREV